MSKETVVVTGAAGRVGTQIVQAFVDAGYAVQASVHRAPPPDHPLVRQPAPLYRLNLATLPEQEVSCWLQSVRPRALVHAAALSDVTDCERQPELAFLLNARVSAMLARICARLQIHFLLLSSEQVFAGTASPHSLYSEEDAVAPLNCYGKSKVQAELVTRDACAGHTTWTICRLSVVYGSMHASGFWRPDFLHWVHSTLARGEAVRIVTDQVNSPIFIGDLQEALLALVRQRLAGIYHLAGCAPVSRYDCALQVARASGLDESLIRPVRTSELDLGVPRPLNVGLCIKKLKRETGIHPRELAAGLASCLPL
jgi:dTDP-4-dehydrorhamnose reductase